VPLEWSRDKNIAWKVEMPGAGNSTPIVLGERLFVSCASDSGRMRSLLAYNRRTGEQLWAKSVHYPKKENTHDTNPFCSSSPVTDGQRIIVWQGSAGLFCYGLDGNEKWKQDLGEFDHIWGNASSPVIHGDDVILNAGPGLRTFLISLKKETGEENWRRTFPDATSEKFDEFRGSWSTPIVFKQGDRELMALSLPKRLIAFEPKTGDTVWTSEGLSLLAYTSPLVSDEVIVGMSGYHGPAIAVKTGGEGDVTGSHRLWMQGQKNPQRVGSGVLVDGHVYGNTFVLEASPQACKVLAENHLDELTRASHAVSDGQIFIRTYKHLWCVQAK
jgi:outer membrane protein assembly factor BamB